jgi:uncharacterized protein (TIGR00369 family)
VEISGAQRLDLDFQAKWDRYCLNTEDIAVTLGITPVSGSSEAVVLRLQLRPAISQPGGMFSAASLFGLADIAGTFLAMEQLLPEKFPLAVQSNVHLLGNTRQGTAEATARLLKAGRTLIVTDTTVTSLDGQLLASVQTTYLNPS